MVRLLSGGPFEWAARDAYLTYLDRVPGFLLSPSMAQSRNYDHLTASIAARVLSHGGNSIDVGANAGYILNTLTKLSPTGSHWAFEPIPRFAERLRKKFPGVTVEEVALSDYTGTAQFNYLPEDPAYSSLLNRPQLEAGRKVQPLSVAVRRLDECIPQEVPIAFIKIDVEGAEAAVLRGAAQLLQRSKPVVVFESSANLKECIKTLERTGFRASLLSDFTSNRRLTANELITIGRERGEYYYVASPE
jgi:FkbM family methyltransferase